MRQRAPVRRSRLLPERAVNALDLNRRRVAVLELHVERVAGLNAHRLRGLVGDPIAVDVGLGELRHVRDRVRLCEQAKLALCRRPGLRAWRDRRPERSDHGGAEVRNALELGHELLTDPLDRLVGIALLGMEPRPEALVHDGRARSERRGVLELVRERRACGRRDEERARRNGECKEERGERNRAEESRKAKREERRVSPEGAHVLRDDGRSAAVRSSRPRATLAGRGRGARVVERGGLENR
jgi:hypothetical protein